ITIEMRHAPFFGWIQDLSAPDPTTVFNLFGLIPWDPSHVPLIGSFLLLGAWPLIMGVTMWVQMKLNPPPPDPTQQIIFDWMPVIFTFMLAGFSAGLVIYWAWNNTLSVIQQSVIMRRHGAKIELFDNVKRYGGGVARLWEKLKSFFKKKSDAGVSGSSSWGARFMNAQAPVSAFAFTPDEIERGRKLFAGDWQFTAAAGSLAALPPMCGIEIAFAGRSNVGKSSLINALTGRNALARTSHTPGRTQELIFFAGPQQLTLVDMPGYGYAAASKTKVAAWAALIHAFLRGRANLARVYLLVDA